MKQIDPRVLATVILFMFAGVASSTPTTIKVWVCDTGTPGTSTTLVAGPYWNFTPTCTSSNQTPAAGSWHTITVEDSTVYSNGDIIEVLMIIAIVICLALGYKAGRTR